MAFDAGDFGQHETERLPGGWRVTEYAARLLKRVGVDAATPGERELLHGPGKMADLERSGPPFVSANIRTADGKRPFDTDMVLTAGGLRVGVTGVTAPRVLLEGRGADETASAAAAWSLEDPATALQSVLPGLRRKSDVVVLLAHMPAHEAMSLVQGLSGVDVVIVGHHPAPGYSGERWGTASVLRTGQKGQIAPMLTLMAGGDSVTVVDTVFKPLAPGDPFEADMQTEISLFESEIKSLREMPPRPDHRNPRAGVRTPISAGEAQERSESHDH